MMIWFFSRYSGKVSVVVWGLWVGQKAIEINRREVKALGIWENQHPVAPFLLSFMSIGYTH